MAGRDREAPETRRRGRLKRRALEALAAGGRSRMRRKAVRARVGFDQRGQFITVPLVHTAISGQTGVGKSTLIRRLVAEFAFQGIRFLLIDVKTERDFSGIGPEITPYLRESTNPLLLKGVLEGLARFSLTGKFDALLTATQGGRAPTLEHVRGNIRDMQAANIPIRTKRDAVQIDFLLEALMAELARHGADLSQHLDLSNRVSVMNISSYPVPIQQLIVDSTLNWVLDHERDVIVVLEEAIRFVPQNEASEAESTARRFVREGRAKGCFLWITGQTLAEVDKRILKQILCWCMGRQLEQNEAERVCRQVPVKGIKPNDIKRLRKGWFIAVVADEDEIWTARFFAWPTWIREKWAKTIARGRLRVSNVQKPKEQEDDAVVDARLVAENEALRKELTRVRAVLDAEVEKRQKAERALRELQEATARGGDTGAATGKLTEAQGPASPSPAAPAEPAPARAAPAAAPERQEPHEAAVPKPAQGGPVRGRVGALFTQGFFDSPRGFSEVRREAERRGWGDWSSGSTYTEAQRELRAMAERGLLQAVEENGVRRYRAAGMKRRRPAS